MRRKIVLAAAAVAALASVIPAARGRYVNPSQRNADPKPRKLAALKSGKARL